MEHITTIYSKAALQVKGYEVGTFSHILNCRCKTFGAEQKERTYQLKKVNFYKFKEYVIKQMKVINFFAWYQLAHGTEALTDALSNYINHKENRAGMYINPNSNNPIDRLLIDTQTTTNQLRARLTNVA